MSFSRAILKWYEEHKRALPWRNSPDPYRVWLSEIILQQTRVAQGLPYFMKFVEHYPTVCDLAKAPEEEVLKLWQGLGYYSRARNLHHTAKLVCFEMGGQFPVTYEGLLRLKGVGPYTAAAIGSICYGLPTAVVDGNVYRVLARYFGVETPIDSNTGTKEFNQLAQEVMDVTRIGEYNQAIMEFGAVQCVPKSPDCSRCPLSVSCWALAHSEVAGLPVKQGRQKVRVRYFHYLVPLDKDLNTVLKQRGEAGIWSKLYEFPLFESEVEDLPKASQLRKYLLKDSEVTVPESNAIVQFNEGPIIHKLSHQHLHTTFWLCHVEGLPEGALSWQNAERLPVPVLIANFMQTLKNSYF